MNYPKKIVSALSWLFGAFFFAGLNFYLFLKKILKIVETQNGSYKAPAIVGVNPPIELGALPGKINQEKMYQVPDNFPGETKCVVLEISASLQPKQRSEEFQFTILTGKDTCIHLFLFLQPFEHKPELSYATEKVQIEIPENRRFIIKLDGRTGANTTIAGEVKIAGTC